MNIMVPISGLDVIDEYCNAGADEFYFGFWDEEWNRRFGIFEEINRMSSFASRANFKLDETEKVIRKVKNSGKKIFMTFNSGAYSERQMKYIDKILLEEHFKLLDGIIGDPTLIKVIKKHNIPITLSTMIGTYNSSIVQFYSGLGIKRMILPRDLKKQDIECIVNKFPDIEFEVFIMRNGCKYSDAYCMSYHGRKCGSMCYHIDKDDFEVVWKKEFNSNYKREVLSNNKLFTQGFHKNACGLCSIKKFMEIGVSSLKIVGRADQEKEIIKDIKLIRKMIDMKDNDVGDEKFSNCLYGLNCYYL